MISTVLPPLSAAPPAPSPPISPVLVRKLGEGARAEVMLTDDPGVAVKLHRPFVSDAEIEQELAALARAHHPHALTLLDVDMHDGRPCALLERLSGPSLAVLLERRGTVRLGEAITLLAPIALAVDALHEAGVAHGAIDAAAVLLRADGAPVLACFGAATVRDPGPPASRETDVDLRADRDALAALVRQVLERSGPASAVGPALDALAVAGVGDGCGARIAEALFASGAAEPVRVDAAATVADIRVLVRTDVAVPEGRSLRSRVLDALASVAPVGIVDRVGAVADGARRVRRPVWFVAVAGVVALVAAVLVVAMPGADGTGSAGSAGSAGASRPAASASSDAAQTPDPDGRASPASPGSGGEDSTGGAVDSLDPTAAESEDAVGAVRALLLRRESCFRALSRDCLDGVDQAGSSAAADDAAIVQSLRQGAPAPDRPSTAGASVAQAVGDGVLVRMPDGSRPASVLVMRTDDGWRIRDYLDDDGPVGG